MPRSSLPAPSLNPGLDPSAARQYLIVSGDQHTNPDVVAQARHIHAEGYLDAGFLRAESPPDLRRIIAAWSIPHECDAKYFVSVNRNDPSDRGTARQLRPAPGQEFRTLPGLRLCSQVLSTTGAALLEAAAARGPVIEISGLARSTGGSPYAVHELIRRMVQEADDAETWVFAIVVETLQSLRRAYGRNVFRDLGGQVVLRDFGGIPVDVTLTPILVRPFTFTQTIRREALGLSDGPQRRRLTRTLRFLEAK